MSLSTAADRPEPVVDEAKIAARTGAVASALLGLAVVMGLITQDDVAPAVEALVGLAAAVVTVINYAAPVIRARKARLKVTPLESPRDRRGVELVAVDKLPT